MFLALVSIILILTLGGYRLVISGIFRCITKFITKDISLVAFIIAHTLFVIFLGRLYALAPDESGYIFTFNNVYSLPISTSAQTASGWITAPTVFVWGAYLPAKILNVFGLPDFLAIRILSILLTAVTLYSLLNIVRKTNSIRRSSQRIIFAVFYSLSLSLDLDRTTRIFYYCRNYSFFSRPLLFNTANEQERNAAFISRFI